MMIQHKFCMHLPYFLGNESHLQSLRSIKGGNFSEGISIFLQSSQNDQRIVFVQNKGSFLGHCLEDVNKNENTLLVFILYQLE